MSYQLVSGAIDDRDLSFDDRHERICAIAHAIQQLADSRRPLLADLGKSRKLRRGEQWARGCGQSHSSFTAMGRSQEPPVGIKLRDSTVPLVSVAADVRSAKTYAVHLVERVKEQRTQSCCARAFVRVGSG